MIAEGSFVMSDALGQLSKFAEIAKSRLSGLNSETVGQVYDGERLSEIKEKMAIIDIDQETMDYIINIAESRLDLTLTPENVSEIFGKQPEALVPIKFHKSGYVREISLLDAMSTFFIGIQISGKGELDQGDLKHEIKTAAMEIGIEAKNFEFMNRDF